jgi:hypothetical protein
MDTASIARPFKKPRIESFVVARDEPKSKNNCCLRPLIQQLALVGSPLSNENLCADLLRRIGLLLPRCATKSIDQHSLKRLHGMVLLYLGFLMPSPSYDAVNGNDRIELLSLVTLCLQRIYKRVTREAVPSVLDPEESKEAFTLVLQTIDGLNDQYILVSDALSTKISRLQADCWDLLKSLLLQCPTLEGLLQKNRSQVENLLFSLLKSVGDNKNPGAAVRKHAGELLHVLQHPSFGPTSKYLARVVTRVLGNGDTEEEISFKDSSNEDQVFLWKCLVYCNNRRCSLAASLSMDGDDVMGALLRMIQADKESCENTNLSIKAMECLCLLAKKLPSTQDCMHVIEAVVVVILRQDSSNGKTYLNLALVCLQVLIERKRGIEALLQSERSQELFSFVASAAFSNRDNGIAREAANILMAMISSMAKNPCNQRKTELRDSFAVVSALLSSEIESVVERALKLVSQLFLDERGRVVFLHPDIISALAKVASNEYASKATRQQAIRIFWIVVEEDTRHINTLARQPKVLESLVCIASLQESGDSDASRRLAMSILLRLSKNVCNRRILAKQPGLLSSMIRYTRALPGQGGGHANVATRSDMKEQILLLASAL